MRASSHFMFVVVVIVVGGSLLVAGCSRAPTSAPECSGGQAPASCLADLSPPRQRTDLGSPAPPADLAGAGTTSPDLLSSPMGLVIGGDAASGYAGATITVVACPTATGTGQYIKIAPFPDAFASGNPVHGERPLELDISSDAIDLFGGNGPNLFYSTRGGVSFPAGNKTGRVDHVVLQPQPGIPGTLTIDGTWQCP